MAFVETPNVARVAMRYDYFGEDVVNTLWVEGPAPYAEVDLQQLAGVFQDWWETDLSPFLASDLNIKDITAIAQDSSTAPSYTAVTSGTGQDISPGLPGNVCITVKFNTAQRGRSGRGRNYVSGLTENVVNGNQIVQSAADNIRIAYENLGGRLTAIGMQHVVVSFQLDGVKRNQGFRQTVLSYQIVNLDLDSQRRRLAGRGS